MQTCKIGFANTFLVGQKKNMKKWITLYILIVTSIFLVLTFYFGPAFVSACGKKLNDFNQADTGPLTHGMGPAKNQRW